MGVLVCFFTLFLFFGPPGPRRSGCTAGNRKSRSVAPAGDCLSSRTTHACLCVLVCVCVRACVIYVSFEKKSSRLDFKAPRRASVRIKTPFFQKWWRRIQGHAILMMSSLTLARSLSLSHPQMSAVKFGEPGEVPSLLVVSNQRVYFLEITSEPQ